MQQNKPNQNKNLFTSLFNGQGFKFSLFNPNQSDQINTQTNLREGQMNTDQKTTQWIDIAKTHCPEVLNRYPYEKYKKEYDEDAYMIKTQSNFQNSLQPGRQWILIKSRDQIQTFTRKMGKEHHIPRFSHKVDEKDMIAAMFNNLSKPPQRNSKDSFAYYDFIQQSAPHDKWNINILGQFHGDVVETEGMRNCFKNTVCKPCRNANKYYVTITTQNIIISQNNLIDGEIEQAITYTRQLFVEYKVPQISGVRKFNVGIRSGRTAFNVGFHKLHEVIKFAYVYNQVRNTQGHYFIENPVKSFSPKRDHNLGKFYTDSSQYFKDVYDEINMAQKKICITGWCITPYLLLKRPIQAGKDIHTSQHRLDHTLDRAAKRGVKIFIMVYQEPSLFVNNDSYNVFNIFQNMDENFKVLRHPGLLIPQLWSHHEKSVIIDERVAFMGGLDICYGRWDIHSHPVNDKDGLWVGADYNNQRQRSITEPRKYDKSNLNRVEQPRMPWHDIALQVKGPSVIDLQRHFVQYWYFAIRDLSDDPGDHLRNFNNRYEQLKRNQYIRRQNENNNQGQSKQSRQQLYKKTNLSDSQMKKMQYDYYNQKKTQTGQKDYTFAQRVKSAKQAFQDLLNHRLTGSSKQIFVEGFGYNTRAGNLRMQLCRSSCSWSTGISEVQNSIYNSYLKLIKQSKELIYIENQFFMSHENLISQQIAARIERAYQNGQKFKVVVMMPLLPGFEGDVTKQSSGVLRVQMQLQYQAISRHKTSIYSIIKEHHGSKIKIQDYITFTGVRNHGLFGPNNDIPKTEIIYVHSKLMIVDDRYMIIGSANINDRSLLGTRDSQLAMVIQDPQGKVGLGKIFDFRCQIFKQHYDMSENQCQHIHSYWKHLNQYARQNAEIYRHVFGCIPDNTAIKYADVARLQKEANIHLYQKKIKDLKGHYVEWPIHFLQEENLSLKFGQKEFIMPITSFT